MGLLKKLEEKKKVKIAEKKEKIRPVVSKQKNPLALKQPPIKEAPDKENIGVSKIKESAEAKLVLRTPKQQGIITKEIEKQRNPIKEVVEKVGVNKKVIGKEWIKTGIGGLDELFERGIPKENSILVAGGAGSGKTILCLQLLKNTAERREKTLYISLEESESKLKEHMRDFKWDPEKLEKKGLLMIKRVDPFKISRSVEALLAKARGELKVDIVNMGELIPKKFKPKLVVIDSLTALSSAFKDEEVNYRVYAEQLFRYLEKLGVTSFLISETGQIPVKYSKTGIEEFLADGVIVLYNIKTEDIRENAIEVLKMRGAKHQKKIVAMQITDEGIVVYPEQEIFGRLEKENEK
ncbi:MAG: ATPase domain-containing protein [archaeon]